MSQKVYQSLCESLQGLSNRGPASETPQWRPMARKKFEHLILADKKLETAGRLSFVFLKAPGAPVIRKTQVESLISFAKSARWIQ